MAHFSFDNRNVEHRGAVHPRGIQSDKALLPSNIALGIEGFHPEIVHIATSDEMRTGVCLSQYQNMAFCGFIRYCLRKRGDRTFAQCRNSLRCAFNRGKHLFAVSLFKDVFTVAHKGEPPVEPFQEVSGFCRLTR